MKTAPPKFVSQQIVDAKRFFLNLNPSIDDSLVVVCGGMEKVRSDYLIERDDFPYFAIEFVAEGEGTLELDSGQYPLTAGSVFAYGPQVSHRIRTQQKHRLKKYFLDIFGGDVQSLIQDAGIAFDTPIHVAAIHEFVDIFDSMVREGLDDNEHVPLICSHLTRLLMAKIKQRRVSPSDHESKAYSTFLKIREYVDNNFMSLSSAQDVSSACDITPIYLSRLFRRFANSGAYEYLLKRKMNRAAELLAVEGMLVKDVASALGFSDAFQFSRAFKRIYGVPPKGLINSRR
jgi:AraC-like DNA-binding protein